MSTFASILTPTSPITNTTLFNGTLVAGTAVSLTLSYRLIVGVTTVGGTDANAAAGIHIRFGNITKAPTATSADWFIPPGTVQFFDMGSEFDRISIISAGTPNYSIYCFSKT